MLTQICEVFKEAYKRGWITSRDGNASYKRPRDNYFYITPSGVRKNQLIEEMFIKMDIDYEGVCRNKWLEQDEGLLKQMLSRNLQPSGELPMHWLLQRSNLTEHSRVVLHLHPTHVIAALSAGLKLPELCKDFPEIYRYTRVGQDIGYVEPISETLGFTVEKAMVQNSAIIADVVGLLKHGTVSVGRDAWEAFEHVERIDHVCEIALAAGLHLKGNK